MLVCESRSVCVYDGATRDGLEDSRMGDGWEGPRSGLRLGSFVGKVSPRRDSAPDLPLAHMHAPPLASDRGLRVPFLAAFSPCPHLTWQATERKGGSLGPPSVRTLIPPASSTPTPPPPPPHLQISLRGVRALIKEGVACSPQPAFSPGCSGEGMWHPVRRPRLCP